MSDQPITLDHRRGTTAQKATQIRRLLVEVDEGEQLLQTRREELECQLIAMPAASWPEAAEKARYLLGLLGATAIGQEPRRKVLIASALEDFLRLARTSSSTPAMDE